MYTEPTPLKKAGDTVSKPGARGLQMQQANQGRLKSVEHVQHTAPTPFKKVGDTVSKPGAHGLQMQQANHMDTTTSCSTCRSTTQQRVWASVLNSSSGNRALRPSSKPSVTAQPPLPKDHRQQTNQHQRPQQRQQQQQKQQQQQQPQQQQQRQKQQQQQQHHQHHQHQQHDEQWSTVTSRKLRGSLGSLRKVYFVGNIDDSCDADSITSHCVQNGITPTACRTFPSRKHVGTKAARLTVREDQCAAIEADGFWPAPIQVRRWDFSEANRPTATK
ncbi:ras-interacting protein RIP3-like [Sycon ciliatum]|uniref:ras-interacting protein RIP3-like n=1 Tax=Sycon ciliatum TaxID=27933 RepID=UPI0031F70EA2